MSGSFVDNVGRWASLPATVAIVAMLALLSWSISTDNLWAAMVSGSLLAAIIVFGGSVVLIPDNLGSKATERTMRIASSTLEHMRVGLTPDSCNAVCQIILPETTALAVSLTDTQVVLAYVGEKDADYPPGSPNTAPTMEVLKSGRMETFSTRDPWYSLVGGLPAAKDNTQIQNEGYPVSVIAPLMVADKPVGTLKLYYRNGKQVDRTQLTIARGLATLISAQLSTYELNRQAELTAQAELKALQAQINPHFLFNTLNTIASLTRTDPAQARELLRDFSVFYRRTLESSESRITLEQELEQTRRYLTIEKARFGEDRIIEREYIEEGLEGITVPSFLVQPIVENAVRHAMRDEGALHIDVHATVDGQDVLIAVADDGLGMDEDAKERLLAQAQMPKSSSSGTGMALRNVAERVERFYGVGSGIEVVSRLGEGTVITLRLADATPGDFVLDA
ncbi:MAG: histidine kinase [Coriobacteriales bacterium]|nr:histidine kinase [Coriobacteriales bacterium]